MGHETICPKQEMNSSRCSGLPFPSFRTSLISSTDVEGSSVHMDKCHLKQSRISVSCLRVPLWSPRCCSLWAGPMQKPEKVNSSGNLQNMKEGWKGIDTPIFHPLGKERSAGNLKKYLRGPMTATFIRQHLLTFSTSTCPISLLFHLVLPRKVN